MRRPESPAARRPATRHLLRALHVLPALTLAACASAPGAARPVEQTRTIVTSAGPGAADIELNRDTRLAAHRSTATPDQLWAALPAALADVGLTGGPAAGQTRTYLASATGLRRQLNKVPLSRYLECGLTSSGAPGADSHLIRLQVTSIVEPDGQGSRLRTQVLARGTSVEGSSGMVDCATTGLLETRLAEAVEARLRQP